VSRYIAHFSPQAWVNDYAIEVDAEGPQEWDCTAFVMQDPEYLAKQIGYRPSDDITDEWGVLDNDDQFKHDPAAPEWIREWRGPFDIRIREGVPE
jgi:hypothetical protein